MAHALIAGGGIGGLTAALSLAHAGCNVTLLEQAPDFVEAGAGIQLSPNCSRVLHHLGLEPALRQVAFLPEGIQFRHWRTGKVISESPLGDAALKQFGAPYYHIHRGDLLRVLLDAARGNPQIELVTNARVLGFERLSTGVKVRCARLETTGDFLVGADGIRSVIREQLWGAEQPRFTGNVAWRALVPAAALPEGLIRPMSTAWWGPGKHFVHYYVRGGSLVNCVCVVEKSGWDIESWTEPGDIDELRSDFAGWHPDITTLIEHTEEDQLFKWALYDRTPMQRWGDGCVTLLGDACHPTLPFMAQGAAMAIEDAAVLGECVRAGEPPDEALKRYERLRRARTARIQNGSRRNARVFHLSGINAWLRNRAVRSVGSRTTDALYSYNALEAAHGDADAS